jgi:hypothetical protein
MQGPKTGTIITLRTPQRRSHMNNVQSKLSKKFRQSPERRAVNYHAVAHIKRGDTITA